MGRVIGTLLEMAFFVGVGWLYLTILRARGPKVKPVGHRIPRAKRSALRRNRYTLPGEWS